MIDINYIINGKRSKPKKNSLMNLMVSPRTIIGDRVTIPQRRMLRQKNRMLLFSDFDRDGVINGLDCMPKNPRRHGVREDIKKLKDENNIIIDRNLKTSEKKEYVNFFKKYPETIKYAKDTNLSSYKEGINHGFFKDYDKNNLDKQPVAVTTMMEDMDTGKEEQIIAFNFKKSGGKVLPKNMVHELGHVQYNKTITQEEYEKQKEQGRQYDIQNHKEKLLEKSADRFVQKFESELKPEQEEDQDA